MKNPIGIICAGIALGCVALAQLAADSADPINLSLPGVAFTSTNAVLAADGATFTAASQGSFAYAPGLVVAKWNRPANANVTGYRIVFGPLNGTNRTTLSVRKDVTVALLYGLATTNGDHVMWISAINATGAELIKSDAVIFKPY